MSSPTVRTKDVRVRFGGLVALDDVDFEVMRGEIHGLIGPNGAGKSTLVNVVAGLQRTERGGVYLHGEHADSLSPSERAKRGLGRTFQHPALFGSLTLRENLELAIRFRQKRGVDLDRDQEAWLDEQVDALGRKVWLDMVVDETPHPVQKITETLRALLTVPDIMLVDEPAAGLPTEDRDELVRLLREARDRLGTGVVIIEHDVPLVFRLCERMTVLHTGRVIAEGNPEEVREDPAVREAYLGADA